MKLLLTSTFYYILSQIFIAQMKTQNKYTQYMYMHVLKFSNVFFSQIKSSLFFILMKLKFVVLSCEKKSRKMK